MDTHVLYPSLGQLSVSQKRLNSFYVDYYNWLQSGAEDKKPFRRRYGLCVNIDLYCKWMDINLQGAEDMQQEFQEQLQENELCLALPFNKDHPEYYLESQNDTMHLNPLRIQWIKDRVESLR
jgi:hypothetical protein